MTSTGVHDEFTETTCASVPARACLMVMNFGVMSPAELVAGRLHFTCR